MSQSNYARYLQLTDGDMCYNEYLACLPPKIIQCVNSPTPQHRQCIKEESSAGCIKCCITNRYTIWYCIIRGTC